MFGGAGIFADGMMFALAFDGVIYLKADEHTVPAFEREGLAPFTYTRKGERTSLSYWRMPDRLYDDPDELAAWARDALAVARRGQTRKQPSPQRARAKNRRKSRRR